MSGIGWNMLAGGLAVWILVSGLAQAQAQGAEPLAGRLSRYVGALAPGTASAGEILAVMAAEPGWPDASLLARRYAQALVAERDDRVAAALCQQRVPDSVPALLRCAALVPHGEVLAQRAWVEGITEAADEVAFLKRWGPSIGPAVQAARWARLAWTQGAAPGGTLARQAVRVDPALRPAAECLLALRRNDAGAADLFGALPPAMQSTPVLVLELARFLRRVDRDADAVTVWDTRGAAAEAAAPASHRGSFWGERNVLARKLLRTHADAAAFAVASGAAMPNGDALFLSGWIALRRLEQPAVAAGQFRALAAASESAITQGRAFYWLGRALAATGDDPAAQAAYRQAAGWTTTYYGQLAALAAGDDMAALEGRIGRMRDPRWDEAAALTFTGSELAQAATLLMAWGQTGTAKAFLGALDGRENEPGLRSAAGHFAAALGLPDQAVAAARLAGRDGVMLPEVGWPEGAEIPPGPVERSVALGLIRQESSFDALARSPVGALGLMQLMPATAAQVSRSLGGGPPGALTDAAVNVRLGTAYLAGQIERFGALPPALAAYNAGPNRVRDWLATNGDPAAGAIDPIDWVELIPFDETRNYVQRIVESVLIYRARAGVVLPHPVLSWVQGSGI